MPTFPLLPGCEDRPCLGFIAHLDTVSDFCDRRVSPEIHEDYDGRISRWAAADVSFLSEMFPHLKDLKGRTLITSDGTTILGARRQSGDRRDYDSCREQLISENIPHSAPSPSPLLRMRRSAWELPTLTSVNSEPTLPTLWTATQKERSSMRILMRQRLFSRSRGVNVHPGSAKDIMVNASPRRHGNQRSASGP